MVGAVVTPSSGGALNQGVEAVSSSSFGMLDRLANLLPLGMAFGAGLVSAANPCGFAMLPAYLGLYLRDSADRPGGRGGRLARALAVGASITVGFVLLFGIVGMAIGFGARSLTSAFPWLGLATGVLLIAAGAWIWFGGSAYSRVGQRVSQRMASHATGGLLGYVAFGLAYGAASLSCTLPAFVAVLGSSLAVTSLPEVGLQLLLYGLGMGLVITVLTLSMAVFQQVWVDRVRRAVRFVGPASAALMLVAGAYVVYYWLTLGGLLRVG